MSTGSDNDRTSSPTSFADDVIEEVLQLEPGEIVSYGEIARRIDAPGSARAVGTVLGQHGDDNIPWWRVVAANGRLVPGHEATHERRLASEGVQVVGGRVPPSLINQMEF